MLPFQNWRSLVLLFFLHFQFIDLNITFAFITINHSLKLRSSTCCRHDQRPCLGSTNENPGGRQEHEWHEIWFKVIIYSLLIARGGRRRVIRTVKLSIIYKDFNAKNYKKNSTQHKNISKCVKYKFINENNFIKLNK